uniref:DUF834 domain-containing protein n=1 Tax=Oryza glumipatula TaxID=40148 RepID=A0A0E0BI50_9ORYZ
METGELDRGGGGEADRIGRGGRRRAAAGARLREARGGGGGGAAQGARPRAAAAANGVRACGVASASRLAACGRAGQWEWNCERCSPKEMVMTVVVSEVSHAAEKGDDGLQGATGRDNDGGCESRLLG